MVTKVDTDKEVSFLTQVENKFRYTTNVQEQMW